jgi:hypothetical protein
VVRLVEHETVLARATGSVGRLDNQIAAAMSNGDFRTSIGNSARRRMEAAARRQPLPSYNHALATLCAAMVGAGANNATQQVTRSLCPKPLE